MFMSVCLAAYCITLVAWHVAGRITCLEDTLARSNGSQYFSMKWIPYTVAAVPKRYWREHCTEACQDSDYSIRLASHLVRAPNSRFGGHEFEFPIRQDLGALTKKWKDPWVQVFLQWWLQHDHMFMSVCLAAYCITLVAWHVAGRITCLEDTLARSNGSQYFSMKWIPYTVAAVPKRYWREHCTEACQDSDYSIRLASHLVRAPNSRSGGHELESPMRRELAALTKKWKDLWGQDFLHSVWRC